MGIYNKIKVILDYNFGCTSNKLNMLPLNQLVRFNNPSLSSEYADILLYVRGVTIEVEVVRYFAYSKYKPVESYVKYKFCKNIQIC